VAAALAAAVAAAVLGASAGHGGGGRVTGPSGPAVVAQGPQAGRGGGDPDRGVVRVADHCSMTAANSLVPVAGGTPPNAGSPDAPLMVRRGGGIPPDFLPVAVITCGFAEETGPDGTVHRLAVERRATADLEPLLVAYQSPMPSFAAGGGCTAQLDTDPAIAFVDAQGNAIWAAAPRDTCQHVTSGVRAALTALTWTVVDHKPVV
jgi:hypothetical protein